MALLPSRNSQPEPCTSALRRVFSDCCKHPPCSRENEQVKAVIRDLQPALAKEVKTIKTTGYREKGLREEARNYQL